MAFIAINAKADVSGSKKGKLTPEQNAQLNAWCLAKKTGILDCLDRCTAYTSSVSNNEATIIFNRGYIVICGRLVECESGTIVRLTTPSSGSTSGKIILRYSLGSLGENEFVVTTKQGVLTQQDLNENPTNGVYEFELYSYVATSTNVTLTRTGEYVPDIGGLVQKIDNNIMGEGKPLYGYDTSKGTIEERLTSLGFKEGSVSLSIDGTATQNEVKRQGNYVFGTVVLNEAYQLIVDTSSGNFTFGTLPINFRPKEKITCGVITYGDATGSYKKYIPCIKAEINTNGTIIVYYSGTEYVGNGITIVRLLGVQFGFEANPL